jgi:hypothetical protein
MIVSAWVHFLRPLKSVVTSASLIVLTKAVSARAELELLMAAINGGSDGLLTTASH